MSFYGIDFSSLFMWNLVPVWYGSSVLCEYNISDTRCSQPKAAFKEESCEPRLQVLSVKGIPIEKLVYYSYNLKALIPEKFNKNLSFPLRHVEKFKIQIIYAVIL